MTYFTAFALLMLTYITAESISILEHSNVTLSQDFILRQMEGVSRLQCSHRCKRDEGCKHIAYLENGRKCIFLKDVPPQNINSDNVKGDEKAKNKGTGKFFFETAPMVFSPQRKIEG